MNVENKNGDAFMKYTECIECGRNLTPGEIKDNDGLCDDCWEIEQEEAERGREPDDDYSYDTVEEKNGEK